MPYSKRFLLISASFFLQLSDLGQLQGNHNGISLPVTDSERGNTLSPATWKEGRELLSKVTQREPTPGMQMLHAAVMQRGARSES